MVADITGVYLCAVLTVAGVTLLTAAGIAACCVLTVCKLAAFVQISVTLIHICAVDTGS